MERRALLFLAGGGAVVLAGGGLLLKFRGSAPAGPALKRFGPRDAAWLAALSVAIVDRDHSAAYEDGLDADLLEFAKAALATLPARPPEDALARARELEAALAGGNELLRKFILQFAESVQKSHYATTEGLASIGYSGPPQPRGYPGYEAAP